MGDLNEYIYGLMQEGHNSIANALGLRLFALIHYESLKSPFNQQKLSQLDS